MVLQGHECAPVIPVQKTSGGAHKLLHLGYIAVYFEVVQQGHECAPVIPVQKTSGGAHELSHLG
ncbi:hypothetical protein KDAU_18490 [Dictyobacter aurantiacus]|uniref:Uncharacterized protein n=1 Tax=Dictyobacter aurantiacus TaxID=1936993 RepID=A0A401ZCA0_9CHLR|nr:hypothetical protein KDAU_18490 [Dictyobacter aurantiacus]